MKSYSNEIVNEERLEKEIKTNRRWAIINSAALAGLAILLAVAVVVHH